MPGGHPPIHPTPESLQAAVNGYFAECEEKGLFPNIAGMTVSLGFCDSQSLFDQQTRGEDFSVIIKRAKTRMWDGKYQAAASGKLNPTIFIFDSINNHGMINTRSENKSEVRSKVDHTITWEFVDPKIAHDKQDVLEAEVIKVEAGPE